MTYENEIIIDLIVENSTLGANIDVAGSSLPTFGSRSVETRLRLRDGEQHLLAGLLREEDRSTLRGFPGMLAVPLLRSLFGDTDEAIRQTDIVMLLTPRIVRTHELTQSDLSPIHIGTQTNFGLSGPSPLIAPQPDAGPPDTPEPDAAGGAPAVPEPAPDAQAVPEPDAADADPAAPVEPEPVVPPPSAQPQTLPGGLDVSAGIEVLVTPPGALFRVGGDPTRCRCPSTAHPSSRLFRYRCSSIRTSCGSAPFRRAASCDMGVCR